MGKFYSMEVVFRLMFWSIVFSVLVLAAVAVLLAVVLRWLILAA